MLIALLCANKGWWFVKNEVINKETGYPRKSMYYAFALLFLLYTFDFIDRYVVVSTFPFLQKEWVLTDTQCGMLMSVVLVSVAVFIIPIGLLLDRWSRKKGIGLMSIFWGFATLASAFTNNYSQLFATRFAIGVGEAGYVSGGTAMISAIFPPEKRARMLGLWQAGAPLGIALGIAIGGLIAVHLGWRHAFGIVAIPGLLIAILFFWVKDYKTVELVRSVITENASVKVKMSKREIIKELFRSRSLIINNIGWAATTFVMVANSTWLSMYFQRYEGFSIEYSGYICSAVFFLSILGAPLGGLLIDKWYKKTIRARLLLPAITTAVSAVLLYISFTWLHGNLLIGVLLVFGAVYAMYASGIIAVTQEVVHPGLRSTSLGIAGMVQMLLGSAPGAVVIGLLSDQYGLDKAMLLLPFCLLLAAILYLIGSFFFTKDVERVEKIEIVFESK
jgi:MFS family permease